MNITINKNEPKPSTIRIVIGTLTMFLAFWVNYKFIGGNNFLDFMMFSFAILAMVGYCMKFKDKIYNNVSDDKIKEIESILNKNESK